MHNMTALSESKSVKNVGVITERTFFHRHFLKRINKIFKNCTFCMHYTLLMVYQPFLISYLTRRHTAQHDSVVKIKICLKM